LKRERERERESCFITNIFIFMVKIWKYENNSNYKTWLFTY
jgi:hypothetical protein